MQLIQFLLIAGVLIAVVLAVRFLPGDRSLAIKRIVAIVFAVSAVLAILFPQALTRVASFFGVGRGTDLLLYVFVLMTLWFAVATIRAKARSDARVTDLARAVALMEARAEDSAGRRDAQP
ncbi:DUF2304 domain-containing protein [Leucobacter komagatae]|uniref:DUF2304 domain-containing protein n=1 Tax=Leucobacter komagatae TaxID=55969 RepID=A0A0D0IPA5_9MICO|nr:DUF2304 domain-containing protein [Leucobacter komagatae]KIP51378.1 hypothetical protein SD72_15745 [Leucobacter komagatae]